MYYSYNEIRNGSNELWIPYDKKKPKHKERIYAQILDSFGRIVLGEITYDRYTWKKDRTSKIIAWFSLPAPYVEEHNRNNI